MRLNKQEKAIKDLYEQGKINLVAPDEATLLRLKAAALATPIKNHPVSIHLSDRDLTVIQELAASKGVSFQELISALVHQFIEGHLVESSAPPANNNQ